MVNDIKQTATKRMDGVIEQLNSNLSQVRTGRANAMILDRVKAEYYGTLTPVNQMAAIKTPDAHTLVIEPWDKSSLGAIEQAIMKFRLPTTARSSACRSRNSLKSAVRNSPSSARNSRKSRASPYATRAATRIRRWTRW